MQPLAGTIYDDWLNWSNSFAGIVGLDGNDTVSFVALESGVVVSLNQNKVTSSVGWTAQLTGVENVTGTSQHDYLAGNDAANTLRGLGGSDTLEGQGGGDVLVGGAGNDTAVYTASPEAITASLLRGKG